MTVVEQAFDTIPFVLFVKHLNHVREVLFCRRTPLWERNASQIWSRAAGRGFDITCFTSVTKGKVHIMIASGRLDAWIYTLVFDLFSLHMSSTARR